MFLVDADSNPTEPSRSFIQVVRWLGLRTPFLGQTTHPRCAVVLRTRNTLVSIYQSSSVLRPKLRFQPLEGLFAPRAGQNFRDEQRRRRSQYDRGTRLAEMEDAYDVDRHDYRGDANPFYQGPPLRYRRSSPYLPAFEEY